MTDRLDGYRDTGSSETITLPLGLDHPEYHALPQSIKDSHTLKEWLWLSDHQKATLVQRETEPEWSE